MTRWLVPGAFLGVAVSTGARAESTVVLLLHHPSVRHLLLALYALLRTAVALAFAAFTIERAEPHRRTRDPIAFIVCTLAMLAIAVVSGPTRSTPVGLLVAGEGVAVLGCMWLLGSVLVLGRCFGVLPEARGLVVRGPYRLVRHPVYLGEIVALVGLVIAAPALWNAIILIVFVAAQLARTHLEERALSDAFPDYARYAANTGRLLPRLGLTTHSGALNTKGAG